MSSWHAGDIDVEAQRAVLEEQDRAVQQSFAAQREKRKQPGDDATCTPKSETQAELKSKLLRMTNELKAHPDSYSQPSNVQGVEWIAYKPPSSVLS